MTGQTFFGAIADDFTGATDLASLIARSGVGVSLRIGIPSEPPVSTSAFEIIALKCRTAPGGKHIGGDKPTKEMPLHSAFYETRKDTGAVVHLHACHSVALSLLPADDPDNFLPPLTPYSIMQLSRVKLLPYFRPGDAAMGAAVRGLAGKRSAVMLANHGPVVAGRDIEAACNAIEELEATARLALLMHGHTAKLLNEAQIRDLVTTFNVEWES